MRPPVRGLSALLTCTGLAVCIAGVSTQPAPSKKAGDGLLRSELSLAGRTVTLAALPDLKAADPAHAVFLAAAPGATSGRVRVGHLDTTGSLKVGSFELAGPEAPRTEGPPAFPSPARYDLWLRSASSGWELEVLDAKQAEVGRIPLMRGPAPAVPILVSAIIPEERATARLVFHWGAYQATTDMAFTTPSRRRGTEGGAPNTTVNRRHDEDVSVLSRARMLAQRSETAVTLPTGPSLSVSYQRTFGPGEAPAGASRNRGLTSDGPDFAGLMSTPSGSVVILAEAPVPRLRIDVPIRFGKTTLATANQVVGFPGSYGLWLKRSGSNWAFVFNDEPDAWGSQHDPKFDKGEVPLTHTETGNPKRPFGVAIVPRGVDRGRLLIVWGQHEWSADFITGA